MSDSNIVREAEQMANTSGGLAASIEATKTRKGAQAATKALRDTNPELAKALIDDRDKVCRTLQPQHMQCTIARKCVRIVLYILGVWFTHQITVLSRYW